MSPLPLPTRSAGEIDEVPRLKSSNEGVLTSARYGNGFPIIRCNIVKLAHSIDSMLSRLFPSIPAEF